MATDPPPPVAHVDPTPSPTTNFRSAASNRAVHIWDIPTGSLTWCGRTEVFWREFRPPRTLADWLAAVHPNEVGGVERAYQRLTEDRLPVRLEFRVRRPDTRVFPVSAHLVSLSPQTAVVCLAREAHAKTGVWDEPARAAATADETTVPAHDPTFERFFELSQDLLCVADLDGRFTLVNQAFVRVLGHPMRELLRQPFLSYVHPDDQAATCEEMKRLTREEPVASFRNRYRTAGGEYRWLEWNARTVPGERRVFAVARDVTERVLLREQLRRQTERERAVLDHTGALVYVKGADGRYQFVNREWERVCGTAAALGRTDAELFPLEFAARFMANDEHVLRTGEPFRGEETAPTPDGTRTYISVKVPLSDEAGAVVAVAGVSTDITDRRRADAAEAELRTARQLQQRLYPAAAPRLPGFDIAGRGRSASTLCGDYFDYIPRADGKLVLAVGDVCGHGLGPALTMVETRVALRLAVAGGGSVNDAARVVNAHLNCAAGDSLFVTLFLAEIDPAERTLRWAGAGHDGRLYRADGTRVKLPSTGPPLGLIDPLDLEPELADRLHPGDVLVLYTDGLTEAMNPAGDQFGTDRLKAVVSGGTAPNSSAAEIVERVFAAVTAHLNGTPPVDDMTMVVVKVL